MADYADARRRAEEALRYDHDHANSPEVRRRLRGAVEALLAVAEAADKREATLRAAAREALDVLTRLADSAAYWSDYDVPVGLVAEVDAAKARLVGVLV